MTPFTRRRVVLIFVTAFLLATGGVACRWLLERGRALAVLETEQAAGLRIQWETPAWAQDQPYLARLWPGAALASVHIDYQVHDAAALGDALKHFGSVGRLSIGQGEMEAVHQVLSHCGSQPHLKSLLIFNVEVDDRILPILEKWQAIESLAMVPNELTGEKFPRMPNLRSIDIAYSRINDKGLVQLASCPMLADVHLSSTSLASSAIIQAVSVGRAHLRNLHLSNIELTDAKTTNDQDKLIEGVRKTAPQLKFDLSF